MPEDPPKPRRLRGAPLNNLNALKHGFYARKFRPADLVDLAESNFKGLEEEMTMLRVYMRSVIEKSPSAASLAESIEILRILSLASTSLTRMARTQKYLESGGPDRFQLLLDQAITETLEELQNKGLKD